MENYHLPVLKNEAVELLNVRSGKKYIDATLGGGGHTAEIIKRGGIVLGIDQDEESLNEVGSKLKNIDLCQGNFAHIKEIAYSKGFQKVDGILFDLGVSTHQLETPERGFSFNTNTLLDMRMNKNTAVSAKDLVNGLNEGELSELILKLGEDNFAKRIAREIVHQRALKPIETGDELARIIIKVCPKGKMDRIHPATRTFQALRIAVNDELNSLREGLPQALELLYPGGRIVVISFHSLEDRIIKNYFKEKSQDGTIKIILKKPIVPSPEEEIKNPRSRSAKLRAAEKITS